MEKIIVEKKSQEELDLIGVSNWSSWGCDISSFDWTYAEKEQAYIIEGEVVVSTNDEEATIKTGDFVTFPKGMSCHWNVTKAINKVYRFV